MIIKNNMVTVNVYFVVLNKYSVRRIQLCTRYFIKYLLYR